MVLITSGITDVIIQLRAKMFFESSRQIKILEQDRGNFIGLTTKYMINKLLVLAAGDLRIKQVK